MYVSLCVSLCIDLYACDRVCPCLDMCICIVHIFYSAVSAIAFFAPSTASSPVFSQNSWKCEVMRRSTFCEWA